MKRAFDIFCAIYGLIVAGPFLLIVSLLIRLESPGPAIFKQKRPTLNNKLFNIYKFRSMKIDSP
ncbi:sugar transferase, partial [Staphylococcus haemolyticus]